jgi:hypothetical protein
VTAATTCSSALPLRPPAQRGLEHDPRLGRQRPIFRAQRLFRHLFGGSGDDSAERDDDDVIGRIEGDAPLP